MPTGTKNQKTSAKKTPTNKKSAQKKRAVNPNSTRRERGNGGKFVKTQAPVETSATAPEVAEVGGVSTEVFQPSPDAGLISDIAPGSDMIVGDGADAARFVVESVEVLPNGTTEVIAAPVNEAAQAIRDTLAERTNSDLVQSIETGYQRISETASEAPLPVTITTTITAPSEAEMAGAPVEAEPEPVEYESESGVILDAPGLPWHVRYARPLRYTGIGLLVAGIAIGTWALTH